MDTEIRICNVQLIILILVIIGMLLVVASRPTFTELQNQQQPITIDSSVCDTKDVHG